MVQDIGIRTNKAVRWWGVGLIRTSWGVSRTRVDINEFPSGQCGVV